MSYADDFEDSGGLLAEQDSFVEDCEDVDGDCRRCSHKYTCWSSDYNTNNQSRRLW